MFYKSKTSMKTLVVADWKLLYYKWKSEIYIYACAGERSQYCKAFLTIKFQHRAAHNGNILIYGGAETHIKLTYSETSKMCFTNMVQKGKDGLNCRLCVKFLRFWCSFVLFLKSRSWMPSCLKMNVFGYIPLFLTLPLSLTRTHTHTHINTRTYLKSQ